MAGKTTRPITDYKDVLNLLSVEGRDGLYFHFAFYTGLRVGEIVNLRWGDVLDEDNKPLLSSRFFSGKQKKYRDIGFHHALRDKISKVYERQPKGMYIFAAKRGSAKNKPMSTNGVNRFIVKKWLQHFNIRLDTKSSHALRKTMARKFYENHGLAATQKMLNHTSSSVTLRYIGVTSEDIENGMRGISYQEASLYDRVVSGDFEYRDFMIYLAHTTNGEAEFREKLKEYLGVFSKAPDDIEQSFIHIISTT